MRVATWICVAAFLVQPLHADPSLGDVRRDLAALFADLQQLQTELAPTGGETPAVAGAVQDRIIAIELEIARLTRVTERLEFRIEQVVRDGTRRVGELESRLCELEQGCVFDTVGGTLPLDGVPRDAPRVGDDAPVATTRAEQEEFMAATAAFEAGEIEGARRQLESFLKVFPGSRYGQLAMDLLGRIHAREGDHKAATRHFLNAFTAGSRSDRAPEILYRLGAALDDLGETEAACLTLAEVGFKFPDAAAARDAMAKRREIRCG